MGCSASRKKYIYIHIHTHTYTYTYTHTHTNKIRYQNFAISLIDLTLCPLCQVTFRQINLFYHPPTSFISYKTSLILYLLYVLLVLEFFKSDFIYFLFIYLWWILRRHCQCRTLYDIKSFDNC